MEFKLIDLRSQMPYLPGFMKAWSRPQLLAWMRNYGTVDLLHSPEDKFTQVLMAWEQEHGRQLDLRQDHFVFCSWSGLCTMFVLTESMELFIPATQIRAWSQPTVK